MDPKRALRPDVVDSCLEDREVLSTVSPILPAVASPPTPVLSPPPIGNIHQPILFGGAPSTPVLSPPPLGNIHQPILFGGLNHSTPHGPFSPFNAFAKVHGMGR